jgi:gamma-glutamyltranspeptidase / glutathione hydrolase
MKALLLPLTMWAGVASAGELGMVSSAEPQATRAGVKVLKAGGNAFDAAVAVAAALGVVEPMNSGVGGYGTIVIWDAKTRDAVFLNCSGRIPAGVDADAYRPPTPGYERNRRGAKAVSTPGNAVCWEALSRRYGRRPWPSLFDEAIRLAEDGFELSEPTARAIAEAFPTFAPRVQAAYGAGGRPRRAGERLVQADLARSLRVLAREGARAMTTGELALAIDRAMKAEGGFLAASDLAAQKEEWWPALRLSYRGHDVLTAPPPANAFDYLVRLGMMGRFDNAALGHNSAEYLHRFAEVTKHGFWVRLRYAGDPEVAAPPLARLLSEPYWAEQVARLDLKRARPFEPPAAFAGPGVPEAHTTHFVVADGEGNVVSATQTLGNWFGSRIVPEGTGLWLNNSLEYCTFLPKGNPMDAHPGRHKLSGDCPTIVLREGRPWAALGTPGGHTIGQTIVQMVVNLVDFRMEIGPALAAPRVSFAEPDELLVEESLPEAVRAELSARGHRVRLVPRLGNAHGLTIEYDAKGRPRFTGAADPRGGGLAASP